MWTWYLYKKVLRTICIQEQKWLHPYRLHYQPCLQMTTFASSPRPGPCLLSCTCSRGYFSSEKPPDPLSCVRSDLEEFARHLTKVEEQGHIAFCHWSTIVAISLPASVLEHGSMRPEVSLSTHCRFMHQHQKLSLAMIVSDAKDSAKHPMGRQVASQKGRLRRLLLLQSSQIRPCA